MIIAVDFDGTCVTNDFPGTGKDIGAVPVLTRLAKEGHKLILLTNRTGESLEKAVLWFRDNGIPLYSVNGNPSQKRFSTSPKIYADLYIDDNCLGCPLKTDPALSTKPFVDWVEVRKLLASHWRFNS